MPNKDVRRDGPDPKVHGPWAAPAGGSEGIGAALADQLGQAGIHLVLVGSLSGYAGHEQIGVYAASKGR
ncbi:hypothetical protein GCM10010261_20280 [Streptomyces pilosus]|uniref:hypothetical protein n=1 Tax=Streptomyces pilosus TaxID=28893 RepID=UPI00167993A6|nr:hypothetical protein [Streptomyces pilosus]GGV45749.1 hypothetical protein GCM10010261_20280 [Streptomyces pilosus]